MGIRRVWLKIMAVITVLWYGKEPSISEGYNALMNDDFKFIDTHFSNVSYAKKCYELANFDLDFLRIVIIPLSGGAVNESRADRANVSEIVESHVSDRDRMKILLRNKRIQIPSLLPCDN
uniref:13-kDa protein n=1 Tax=Citrus tristeza virus TaxID=12162 RepID=Q9DTF6_9CLOS|nr:13-kDa protein [Citrus tristeza virus]